MDGGPELRRASRPGVEWSSTPARFARSTEHCGPQVHRSREVGPNRDEASVLGAARRLAVAMLALGSLRELRIAVFAAGVAMIPRSAFRCARLMLARGAFAGVFSNPLFLNCLIDAGIHRRAGHRLEASPSRLRDDQERERDTDNLFHVPTRYRQCLRLEQNIAGRRLVFDAHQVGGLAGGGDLRPGADRGCRCGGGLRAASRSASGITSPRAVPRRPFERTRCKTAILPPVRNGFIRTVPSQGLVLLTRTGGRLLRSRGSRPARSCAWRRWPSRPTYDPRSHRYRARLPG